MTEHNPEPAPLSDLGRALLAAMPQLVRLKQRELTALATLQQSESRLVAAGHPAATRVHQAKGTLRQLAAGTGPAAAEARATLREFRRTLLNVPENAEEWRVYLAAGLAYAEAVDAAIRALTPLTEPHARQAEELAGVWRDRLNLADDATKGDAWRLLIALEDRIERVEFRDWDCVEWMPSGKAIVQIPEDDVRNDLGPQGRKLAWLLALVLLGSEAAGMSQWYPAATGRSSMAELMAYDALQESVYRLLVKAFLSVWEDGVKAAQVQVRIAWRNLTGRYLCGAVGFPSRRTAGRLARRYPGRIRIDQADIRKPYMALRRDGGFVITYPQGRPWPREDRRRRQRPRRRRM